MDVNLELQFDSQENPKNETCKGVKVWFDGEYINYDDLPRDVKKKLEYNPRKHKLIDGVRDHFDKDHGAFHGKGVVL